MTTTRLNAKDMAALSGLDLKEVERMYYLYDDDHIAMVRASEICHLKTHYINNPTEAIRAAQLGGITKRVSLTA